MWSALCARAAPEPERLAALAGARAVAQRSASPAARELIYLAEREIDVLGRRVPALCPSACLNAGGTMAPASLHWRSCLGEREADRTHVMFWSHEAAPWIEGSVLRRGSHCTGKCLGLLS